jgi:SAM-dependent methyltransferase
VQDQFIKQTIYNPVQVGQEFVEKLTTSGRKKRNDVYSNPDYIKAMMVPAATKLRDLRKSCDGAPLRMLVTARTNAHCELLARIINDLPGFHFHAEYVTGGTKLIEKASFEDRFSCNQNDWDTKYKTKYPTKRLIDIGVHCRMLSEGYDNNWIAISTFVAPAFSLSVLSQLHGRAIRMNPQLKGFFSQARNAFMFFPDIPELQRLINDYRDGVDEDPKKILLAPDAFASLADAHTTVTKMTSVEAVLLLKKNFEDYHDKYEKKRDEWEEKDFVIPAETLALLVFEDLIEEQSKVTRDSDFTCNIVDFGCGRDGVFEVALSDHVGKSLDEARGSIEVVGIDVIECTPDTSANSGFDPTEHLQFHFTPLACNYNDVQAQAKFQAWVEPEGLRREVDAAVFCLALMAQDAIPEGLIAAMDIVKPGGLIYIVLDPYKFGILGKRDVHEVKENIMKVWVTRFNDIFGSVVYAETIDFAKKQRQGDFIYLRLKMTTADDRAAKSTLYGKLRRDPPTTLKTLQVASDERDRFIASYQAVKKVRKASLPLADGPGPGPGPAPDPFPGPKAKRQKIIADTKRRSTVPNSSESVGIVAGGSVQTRSPPASKRKKKKKKQQQKGSSE